MEDPGTISHFLQIPLNVSFCFLCNPLLILRNRDENDEKKKFKKIRFWPHTLVVGILSVANLLWIIAIIRSSLPTVETSNPLVFINLLYILITLGSHATFLVNLWFPGDKFVNLITFLCSTDINDLLQLHPRWVASRSSVFAASILFSVLGLMDATINPDVDYVILPPGQTIEWWSRLVRAGRKLFFLSDKLMGNQSDSGKFGVDIISGIVAYAGVAQA